MLRLTVKALVTGACPQEGRGAHGRAARSYSQQGHLAMRGAVDPLRRVAAAVEDVGAAWRETASRAAARDNPAPGLRWSSASRRPATEWPPPGRAYKGAAVRRAGGPVGPFSTVVPAYIT